MSFPDLLNNFWFVCPRQTRVRRNTTGYFLVYHVKHGVTEKYWKNVRRVIDMECTLGKQAKFHPHQEI